MTEELNTYMCGEMFFPIGSFHDSNGMRMVINFDYQDDIDKIHSNLYHSEEVYLDHSQSFKTASNTIAYLPVPIVPEFIEIFKSPNENDFWEITNKVKITIKCHETEEIIAIKYVGSNGQSLILENPIVLSCDNLILPVDLRNKTPIIEFQSICEPLREECCDKLPSSFTINQIVNEVFVDCIYYCVKCNLDYYCIPHGIDSTYSGNCELISGPHNTLQDCQNVCDSTTTTTTTTQEPTTTTTTTTTTTQEPTTTTTTTTQEPTTTTTTTTSTTTTSTSTTTTTTSTTTTSTSTTTTTQEPTSTTTTTTTPSFTTTTIQPGYYCILQSGSKGCSFTSGGGFDDFIIGGPFGSLNSCQSAGCIPLDPDTSTTTTTTTPNPSEDLEEENSPNPLP